MEIEIRLGKESDLEVLLEIDKALGDVERAEKFLIYLKSRTCWVAEFGSVVQGFVLLDYSFFDNGFIHLILVREGYRRTGIGEGLMKVVMKKCKTKKLFSSTNLSNEPMQKLFEKLGFTQSGVIENLDLGDPELIYFIELSS